jgi:predicted 3-demethylubiquinone-9 3-methyltransferase (glyoxalase superfamily)
MNGIRPCLWFDTQAEEAANFYTSLFKNSRIVRVTHYGETGPREAGMVLTVEFELDGRSFTALNGGPEFTFDEAISFEIDCDDQAEADHYWQALGEGGEYGQCGWLKDKYGVSWQVVPRQLYDFVFGPDATKANAAMKAMMSMGKLDVAELERAYNEAG